MIPATIVNTFLLVGCYTVCDWYNKLQLYKARNRAVWCTALLVAINTIICI